MNWTLKHIALISAALAGVACDETKNEWPAPAEPFLFETTEGVDIGLQVVADGAPLAGAHVTLRAVPREGETPAVLWSGVTNGDGHLRGGFARPQTLEQVDVIVKAPGYVGSCPDERCAPHGAFAPAAWLRVPSAELAGATVALERGTR